MAWTTYKRHLKNCDRRDDGREWKRCKCPFWAYNVINGEEIRKSLGVSTADEAEASLEKLKQSLENPKEKEPSPEPVTIAKACEEFLSDARARELREPTLDKYKLLFRRLQSFAESEGLRYISEINLDAVRAGRTTTYQLSKSWNASVPSCASSWIVPGPLRILPAS